LDALSLTFSCFSKHLLLFLGFQEKIGDFLFWSLSLMSFRICPTFYCQRFGST
jgi:hypothetical protein